jgi:negative regulator of sigma E activity
MKCHDLRQKASSYLDRQLIAAENQEVLWHLNRCRSCYEYVDELKQTIELMRQMAPVAPPPALAKKVTARLVAESVCHPQRQWPVSFWERLVWCALRLRQTLFYNRPQYVSYVAGVGITCLLFAGVIYGLRPNLHQHMTDVLWAFTAATPTIDIPAPRLAETLPSFASTRGLDDLAAQADREISTRDLFVVADISSEGRAQSVRLVGGSKNTEPYVAAALRRVSFKPGTRGGRPVNSRLLIYVQTIDVRGSS